MLDIVLYGDDVLRQKAKPIEEVTPKIRKLAENMLNTMYESEGVGLAGPQVGESLRIVVIDTSVGFDPEAKLILLNPEIIEESGEQYEDEGCLSLPQLWAKVKRPAKVTARYTDIDGNEKTVTGTGMLAKALSHEIDHLDGILFIDHITGLEKKFLMNKLKKLMEEEPWTKAS
ncbi:MAG: peptide deformylase [Acidobacteria bacterium]|nr:peptide deformylase [Acidobacteriota bacterium]